MIDELTLKEWFMRLQASMVKVINSHSDDKSLLSNLNISTNNDKQSGDEN